MRRNDILKAIENREPLSEKTIIEDAYMIHGVSYDATEYPLKEELLYDIAVSLRLLIDAVVETWTG